MTTTDLEAIAARRDAEDLGHAWQEAEAALPEGWDMGIMSLATGERTAWAGYTPDDDEERESWVFDEFVGETHAAALRALAAKLREQRP